MKTEITKVAPGKVKVTCEVDQNMWKEAQKKAFKKESAKVSIPGFRPGKAPEAMLKERVNPSAVADDAINSLLNPVLNQVITEQKINPFLRPDVSVEKLSDTELTLVFTVVLYPEVTLGEYKGLKAEKVAPSVTDEEVNAAITKLLEGNADLVSVEREAKEGDSVTLDFEGFIKGEDGALKPFDGGKADNYVLVLGSHQFVPGFEEALVGTKTGEKKDIVVTFPTNYVKDLAGKEATFKCHIHEIKEKQIPALDDETVKGLAIKDKSEGTDVDVVTVDGLKEYEKKTLLATKVHQSEDKYFNDIIDAIVKNATFVIADEVIAEEGAAKEEQLKKQVEQNGLSFEQYLEITGTKEEDLKAKMKEEGERSIKTMLAFNKVAETEKIVVTSDEIEAEFQNIADQYKMPLDEVKKALGGRIDDIRGQVRGRKIADFIKSVSK